MCVLDQFFWTSSGPVFKCTWIFWGPCVKADSGLVGMGCALDSAFLRGSQVLLMFLVCSPLFEEPGHNVVWLEEGVVLPLWLLVTGEYHSLLWSFENTEMSGFHSQSTHWDSLGLWLGHACFEKVLLVLWQPEVEDHCLERFSVQNASTPYRWKLPTDLITFS